MPASATALVLQIFFISTNILLCLLDEACYAGNVLTCIVNRTLPLPGLLCCNVANSVEDFSARYMQKSSRIRP
jgi:hypothetical protein